MTTVQGSDPLVAVRASLLARAASDGRRVLDSADADVAARVAEARSCAADEVAAAVAAAERDAAVLADETRARARRQARSIVLAAQGCAFDLLRAQARRAVRTLRDDPGYPDLVARLGAAARDRLGTDATVRQHPDGGVLAEAGDRRLALTLDAAADRAVDGLGAAVEELWRP